MAGGFDGVAHGEYGLLAGAGVGAGIGEEAGIELLLGALVLGLDVDVFCHAGAVVVGYVAFDDLGEFHAVGEGEAFADVAYDDLGGLLVGEAVVGVDAVLVLGEEDGVAYLADVVVEGSGADDLGLGAYLLGDGGAEVGDLHAVLEGAGGFFAHLAEEGGVGVGEFEEGDGAGEAEAALDGYEEKVGDHHEEAAEEQADDVGVSEFAE